MPASDESGATAQREAKRAPETLPDPERAAAGGEPALPVAVQIHEQRFIGPLPPADALARYEEIVPGCAERIMDNFIEQGPHRRTLQKRGQAWTPTIIAMILLTVLGCAYIGATWASCAVAVVGLGLFAPARVFPRIRDASGE